MEVNVKEFADRLREMAKDFEPKDYRANAKKELEKAREAGLSMPHAEFIAFDYPEFNHIQLKLTAGDSYQIRMCINPKVILENPGMAEAIAEMYVGWMAMGAKEE